MPLSLGAYVMWSRGHDREKRLQNAHDHGFASDLLHARRLFGAHVDLEELTEKQWRQVAAAKKAYIKANALKGVRAKRLKAAQRLREKAEGIEAQVAEAEAAEAGPN